MLTAPFRAFVRATLPAALQPRDESVGSVALLADGDLQDAFSGASVLIVGGTKGIGSAIAGTLSAAGAKVVVVGRSASPPDVPGDLSTVAGCLDVVEALKARGVPATAVDANALPSTTLATRYSHVIFTVGTWPDVSSPRNTDGIDKVFQLDLLARHIILTRLLEAKLLDPMGCRIMSVLASAQHYPPSLMDGDSVRTRLTEAVKPPEAPSPQGVRDAVLTLLTTAVAHDAWLHHLGKLHAARPISFIGTFPGLLVTDLPHTALPSWLASTLKCLMAPVADSDEIMGRNHCSILASLPFKSTTYFAAPLLEARLGHPLALSEEEGLGKWVYDLMEAAIEGCEEAEEEDE